MKGFCHCAWRFSQEKSVIGNHEPTNDSSEEEKNIYCDALRDTIGNVPNRKEIVLLGDLNGRVGKRL